MWRSVKSCFHRPPVVVVLCRRRSPIVDQELVESEPASSLPAIHSVRGAVSIPDAAPVRLQTLDLARHVAIAPDEKRYVVATFDDHRVGNGFVTAIYPQQNDYLTLIQ